MVRSGMAPSLGTDGAGRGSDSGAEGVGEPGPAADPELAVDVREVPLDRLHGHRQLLGDLPVGQPARRPAARPALGRGQRGQRLAADPARLLAQPLEQVRGPGAAAATGPRGRRTPRRRGAAPPPRRGVGSPCRVSRPARSVSIWAASRSAGTPSRVARACRSSASRPSPVSVAASVRSAWATAYGEPVARARSRCSCGERRRPRGAGPAGSGRAPRRRATAPASGSSGRRASRAPAVGVLGAPRDLVLAAGRGQLAERVAGPSRRAARLLERTRPARRRAPGLGEVAAGQAAVEQGGEARAHGRRGADRRPGRRATRRSRRAAPIGAPGPARRIAPRRREGGRRQRRSVSEARRAWRTG